MFLGNRSKQGVGSFCEKVQVLLKTSFCEKVQVRSEKVKVLKEAKEFLRTDTDTDSTHGGRERIELRKKDRKTKRGKLKQGVGEESRRGGGGAAFCGF